MGKMYPYLGINARVRFLRQEMVVVYFIEVGIYHIGGGAMFHTPFGVV